jgi:hypothetical protein
LTSHIPKKKGGKSFPVQFVAVFVMFLGPGSPRVRC